MHTGIKEELANDGVLNVRRRRRTSWSKQACEFSWWLRARAFGSDEQGSVFAVIGTAAAAAAREQDAHSQCFEAKRAIEELPGGQRAGVSDGGSGPDGMGWQTRVGLGDAVGLFEKCSSNVAT